MFGKRIYRSTDKECFGPGKYLIEGKVFITMSDYKKIRGISSSNKKNFNDAFKLSNVEYHLAESDYSKKYPYIRIYEEKGLDKHFGRI